MEEAKIEEEFANKLNGLDLLEEVDVSAICWFVEDFEKCSEIFAYQIIDEELKKQILPCIALDQENEIDYNIVKSITATPQ